MAVVNIAIYYYLVNSLKLTIYNKLEAIRDLKVNELEHWLEEKIIDIRTIASDDDIRIMGPISEGNEEARPFVESSGEKGQEDQEEPLRRKSR